MLAREAVAVVLTRTSIKPYRIAARRPETPNHAPKNPLMQTPLLVLNYNGDALLRECLPSVLRAAERSRRDCPVMVIDNGSTDDSLTTLAREFPQVQVRCEENFGLCSYNRALAELDCRVAILLNNDIKLHEDCIDPLVAPLLEKPPAGERPCFMTAPLCWLFDGKTYEGLKTSIRWRWGLVQATALFDGYQQAVYAAGETASAGAVMAVDRQRFLALGGFDPLYLPGRIEDLDFSFRGYQAGFRACYVPAAVAYHRGLGTFGAVYSKAGCDHLAMRNTLLFQWKNLRGPAAFWRQAVGLPARLARDVLRAPFTPKDYRFAFIRAMCAALAHRRQIGQSQRARRGRPPTRILSKVSSDRFAQRKRRARQGGVSGRRILAKRAALRRERTIAAPN